MQTFTLASIFRIMQNACDTEPADVEWVSMPPVPSGTDPRIAAAEIGSLDLVVSA